MLTLWRHILEIGAKHGVNPWIFAVLYLAHHPLFWGTMAWLAACVRAKKSVTGVIFLGVFFWFLPYTYVFIFGRDLPHWVYVLAAVFVVIGGIHVVKEVRRRLRTADKSEGINSSRFI